MSQLMADNQALYAPQKKIKLRKPSYVVKEEAEILQTMLRLKQEMDVLDNNFNNVTDPVLVDSYIYETMAAQMKYKYYLKLCKEKGLYGME